MPRFLKKSLLLFWAALFTIVTASNVADLLRTLQFLDGSWPFASGNFEFVSKTTARYGVTESGNLALFAIVIVWEALTTLFFWRAFWANERSVTYAAFTAGLFLWMGFVLVDEICIAYGVEATHLRLFVAQLVTLLAIELLPEGSEP